MTMDLNERLVSGGASYPGHVAVLRGPQVMTLVAVDRPKSALQRAKLRLDKDTDLQLTPASEILPKTWIGGHAYMSPATVNADGCFWLPFADAGQPGLPNEYRTWIPLSPFSSMEKPAKPKALRASAISSDQIRLEWTTGGSSEEGHRVERRRADGGIWFHVKTTASTESSCQDDSVNVVLPGKTYRYRVAAYNTGGLSEYSNEVTVKTPSVGVPRSPSGLQLIAVSSSQINLTWDVNSTNEEGFRVERRTPENPQWVQIAGRIPAGLARLTDHGLQPNQTYAYRVAAYNAAGASTWTKPVQVATNKQHASRRGSPSERSPSATPSQ